MSSAPWSSEPPVSAIRPACAGSMPCLSASEARKPGLTAAASRHASSFDSRERAPLRPSQVPKSSIIRSTWRRRDRRPHAVERMRERVCEAALAEECDELVHRRTERLQVAVVLLGQVPHENVERHLVLGEACRHLDGEERVGLVRDAQRTLDRVVVADRDVRHAALPADAIHALGLRVRLAETCAAECVVPAVRRVDRVDVQVATAHCPTCKPLPGRLLPVSGE